MTREQFIEQAMDEHEGALLGYAYSILHDRELAQDIVQDTFMRLCQQAPADVDGHLKSWLFTVCRNRALDWLRKHRREESLEDQAWEDLPNTSELPDAQLDTMDRGEQVFQWLQRLSANQRDVLLLKFQQGYSYEEIHQITGLSLSNIGFLIHAGLKRLRAIVPTDWNS